MKKALCLAAGAVALVGTATAAAIERSSETRTTDAAATALAALLDPAQSGAALCRATRRDGQRAYTLTGRIVMAAAARAATPDGKIAGEPHPSTGQPLWSGYGRYGLDVTTVHDRAQRYFDQGLRFVFAFNHAEAVRAFRTAQAIDPECAMCYWGEALALGANINAPMPDEALAPAFAAVAKASLLSAGAAGHERALIAALARRYSPREDADRATLEKAYADAMRGVAGRFPENSEIQVLFAESLMNLQPWDYWQPDRRTGKGNTDEIVATLERVLERDPDHATAIHLYIHTVEASATPERAKPYADRLAKEMPAAGHIVHMPSHIYYRLGLWQESLDANIAAVKADEAYLAQVDAKGIYPGGYYPHNIHFVVTSAQMAGAGETAVAYAGKLAGTIDEATAKALPMVQPMAAAPYYAHAMFSAPKKVLALPAPGASGASVPFLRAAWRYARAEALIARGDIAGARGEMDELSRLAASDGVRALEDSFVPGPAILGIAGQVIAGRIAMKAGDYEAAVAAFREAAEAQDRLPYMEPPYWYYPVRQSLGAALVRAGRPQEAVQAFRAALAESPNNGWAIFGLAEAYRAAGDEAAAKAAEGIFARTWLGGSAAPALDRL